MKKICLLLLILFQFAIHGQLNAKTEQTSNQMSVNYTYSAPTFGPTGILRVLIVFCKFSSDTYDLSPDTDMWPSSSTSLPTWGSNFLSTTVQSEYNNPTLSGYFDQVSFGNLQVIGDAVYYQPAHEESYYYTTNNRNVGFLAEEVLQGIDSNVNYANYDNWDPNDVDHDGIVNEPDGKVDMIVIAFRTGSTTSLDGHEKYQGISSLAGYSETFPSGPSLTLDGKIIYAGVLGSGIFEVNAVDPHSALRVTAHEMGHYLIGLVHFNGIGYHGVMDGAGSGIYSSYEAYKLGWVSPTTITSNITNVSLPDYLTSGTVYKLPITSSEYFLIDNHQRRNYYEDSLRLLNGGGYVTPGKGIIITHCFSWDADIESAFGLWDWKRNTSGYYFYPFEKDCVNRTWGMDKLNLRDLYTPSGRQFSPDHHWSQDDYFNIGYNEVFTPYSNPSTYSYTANNYGVELVSQDPTTGNITCNFYVTNPENADPSKPQNLKVAYNTSQKPCLSWEANIEPNLSGYKIYRAKKTSGVTSSYACVATLNSTAVSWTDQETVIGDTVNKICYKITALNSLSKESVVSDSVCISYVDSLISFNTTLSGTVYIENNLQLAKNTTVTLQAGTKVYLATGVNINILGTFSAAGTSTNHIIFDREAPSGLWGAIIFNGNQTDLGGLRYVTLRNGWGIKYLAGCNNSFCNSLVEDCTNGVYIEDSHVTVSSDTIKPTNYGIFGSGSDTYVVISDNVITKLSGTPGYHNYQGIYLHNGSIAFAYHNDIRGFGFGMYYGGSTTTYFLDENDYTPNVNNRLYSNYQGLGITWSAVCYAGDSYAYGGNNSIYGNTLYQTTLYQNGFLMANCNYWGGSTPTSYNCDSSSAFNYANYYTSDPWLGQGLKINTNQNFLNSISPVAKTNTLAKEFRKARVCESAGEIEKEINVYKNLASSEIFGKAALSNLARLQSKYNRPDISQYFANLVSSNHQYKCHIQTLLAKKFLLEGKYNQAMNIYDELIAADPDGYEGINAKMEMILAFLHIANDRTTAAKILNEVKSLSSDDGDLKLRIAAAETLLYGESSETSEKATVKTKSFVDENLKNFDLSANYPNPFNPTTSISYQIPNDGMVSIKVYDALGREVACLVNESKIKGCYNVPFNATSLPSGMYFYTMKSGKFSSTKKMMLLK